jgi:hypothetical protein
MSSSMRHPPTHALVRDLQATKVSDVSTHDPVAVHVKNFVEGVLQMMEEKRSYDMRCISKDAFDRDGDCSDGTVPPLFRFNQQFPNYRPIGFATKGKAG